jgi:anthranilate synthase component 1
MQATVGASVPNETNNETNEGFFPASQSEFGRLAAQGNLVPVWCEVLADVETPVSAFLKLRKDAPNTDAWLLESVEGGENQARYSFLGTSSRASLRTRGRRVSLEENGRTREWELEEGRDPLHLVQELMERFRFVSVPGLPDFCGGAVGYLGWELVRFFEKLPNAPHDDRDLDDVRMLLTDTLLIFDSVRHTIKVLCNAFVEDEASSERAYGEAKEKITRVLEALSQPLSPTPTRPIGAEVPEDEPLSNFPSREAFESVVSRTIEYIHSGDCVQVVPSQRFSVPLKAEPFEVYRALRHVSPAPYMFFLSLGDVQLIGASPEILVTEKKGLVRTRPLAGTRPRGRTPEEDEALEAELLADPKEIAEHVMLVDLGRNDLGRVSEYGSVKVNDLMVIERYSHVMHIASDVTGQLRADKTGFDVLRATFPAGTLSGAPKVRAMQIIDEMEPTRRGPYGGAIGYFSFNGNLDTCITLRTIVVKDGVAYVQAGGGVVADSVPANEYDETRNKARAALRAIALAERHLG